MIISEGFLTDICSGGCVSGDVVHEPPGDMTFR